MKKQSKTVIVLPKWYHNIHELPLDKFIDCIVDNNIHALVIAGHPSPEELAAAWHYIQVQYADAMQDHEYKAYIRFKVELFRLESIYNQIHQIIPVLRDRYVPQFKKTLNHLLRSNLKLDPETPEAYDSELKRAYNMSKGIMIDIKLKQMEIEERDKRKEEKGDTMTRAYFERVLINLRDEAGYYLRANEMTTFEWCERYRRLRERIENETKKNKKK